MATRAGYGGGSLRRRGDRKWELRVSTGRDPVRGRYRYVSRTVHGTRKEAEAALAALVTQVNTGAGGHTGTDATVGELVEQWLDLKRDALSVTTWEGYAGKARFRLIPALGKVSVRRLTVRDIDAFYRALARDEQLAASTIRQIHNVLTGSLDQANPARLATLPSVRRADVRPPAPADVMAAIERADQELALFVRLSAVIGGRRGEVGALRWTDADLSAGDLAITKALVESRDRSIYEKDTKTHQARRIALDAATVEALQAWRSEVEARAKLFGVALRSDGFVFSPEIDGSKPWRPYHWTSAWRRLRDRIGLDPAVRLHDLRHFTATQLLDAGVPVKTVSGRLGHARPATTLNVYAHFIPATDRVAADVIGGLLTPSSPVDDPELTSH
jgi:integrase